MLVCLKRLSMNPVEQKMIPNVFLVSVVIFLAIASCKGKSCDQTLSEIKTLLDRYTTEKGCANGWMTYGNHCYFLSSDKRTWQQAEQNVGTKALSNSVIKKDKRCRRLGSHLVKVDDAKENDWIYSKAPKGGHILWLGGNDINKEGKWVWAGDLSPLSYTQWNKWDAFDIEPNGKTSENCMNMMGYAWPKASQNWNDNSCSSRMYYMCEKKMV